MTIHEIFNAPLSSKLVTEKDAVLRERAAYVEGRIEEWEHLQEHGALLENGQPNGDAFTCLSQNEDTARDLYPLPQVKIVRTVMIEHTRCRYNSLKKRFEYERDSGDWDFVPLEEWFMEHLEEFAKLKADPYTMQDIE